jgi:YggT family protein
MLTSLPLQLKYVIQLMSGSTVVFLKIYTVILSFRLYASWFPNINLYDQPFSTVASMTNFYIRFWRKLVPFTFILDLSPVFGFWAIDTIVDLCDKLSRGIYLY